MTSEKKKYDNQTVARRLALQTLNNIDNLSFYDIKRRLTNIIECLSPDDMEGYREWQVKILVNT